MDCPPFIIRPVTAADVAQVVEVSREVQKDMAVDIIWYHLRYISRHPWPYSIAAVFIVIVKLITEWSVSTACTVGLVLAALEETCRFILFFRTWHDIFLVGDDVHNVMDAFAGPKRQFLLAEQVEDGKIVATVGIREQEERNGHDRRGVGQIVRMFVLSSCRGKGIGSRLMDTATEELRARGYQTAELLTHHSNSEAIRFYRKRGYSLFNVIHFSRVFPYVYDQHEFVLSLEEKRRRVVAH